MAFLINFKYLKLLAKLSKVFWVRNSDAGVTLKIPREKKISKYQMTVSQDWLPSKIARRAVPYDICLVSGAVWLTIFVLLVDNPRTQRWVLTYQEDIVLLISIFEITLRPSKGVSIRSNWYNFNASKYKVAWWAAALIGLSILTNDPLLKGAALNVVRWQTNVRAS